MDDTAENGGPGDGFRPTALLMGGLGACMIGTMINFANNQGISVSNISMTLEDEPAQHPDRIGIINAVMHLETDADDRRRASLERVAGACKIHNTLEQGPEIRFVFQANG